MKKNVNLAVLSREELEKEYIKLHVELENAQAQLDWYIEQYALSKARRFGQSSEAGISGQLSFDDLPLFNEAEALREPIVAEPKPETVLPSLTENKKPRHGKHKKKLPNLPVYEDVFFLSGTEKNAVSAAVNFTK